MSTINRATATSKYGAIDASKNSPQEQWPNAKKWIVRYDVPTTITENPNYHWTVRGNLVKTIYINKDLVPMLTKALETLQQNDLLNELDTYNGCWVIRQTRGSGNLSSHSWGIAIDINAENNQLGCTPTMTPDFVQKCVRK